MFLKWKYSSSLSAQKSGSFGWKFNANVWFLADYWCCFLCVVNRKKLDQWNFFLKNILVSFLSFSFAKKSLALLECWARNKAQSGHSTVLFTFRLQHIRTEDTMDTCLKSQIQRSSLTPVLCSTLSTQTTTCEEILSLLHDNSKSFFSLSSSVLVADRHNLDVIVVCRGSQVKFAKYS